VVQQPDDSPADWQADLALAQELADLADGITTARFRADDLTVRSKPDLSLVTDADRAVEQAIRSRLAELRPRDALLGEEFGRAGDADRQWVIDPIDGTHNYVRGVPVWATLIGLLDGRRPVVGMVSAPALGQRWWAATGHGAFGRALGSQVPRAEPRRLRVSAVGSLADASMSYSSLSGWADRLPRLLELLGSLWRSRGYGDFWSYMLLAEGAVDLAAEPELSLWDMAALAPIVVEAGGRFTGLDGVDGVHQGNAAASNGLLHDALLAALGNP
jgi:histidinol-phosphatase